MAVFVCRCWCVLSVCAYFLHVCGFQRKAMAQLTDDTHTHTHTHTQTHISRWRLASSYQGDGSMQLGPSASVMCLFTSLQKACLLLSTQTDSPSSTSAPPPPPKLCLFIIDQEVAAFPEGLRHGNFYFFLLLLLLFALDLNVLVQTLFPPAGRAAPYARPVKAAVVMDTGKHHRK